MFFKSGSIKVWDFGSGQLYKTFPDEHAKKKHEETITGLAFYTMYNKRCLLVSSWGKKIKIMEVGNLSVSSFCFVYYQDISILCFHTKRRKNTSERALAFDCRVEF